MGKSSNVSGCRAEELKTFTEGRYYRFRYPQN